jgi:acyl-CoA synthetase
MVRFEDVLADTASPPPHVRIRPEDPAVVGYTSGTGAAPKGVVLTHRAMAFDTTFHIGRAYTTTRPILNGSPVTHMAGMLVSLLVPAVRDDEIHLIDKWEPGRVLEIMRRENLTSGWGAAIFLTSLVDHPDAGPEDLARIERCYLGGSPIPAALVARVEAQGIWVGRGYGCTEQPTVTFSRLDDPYDKRVHTNGRALTGVEIITVDDDGRELSPGTDGELLIRGPDRFSGYMDANLTATAIDKDGWFRTGDIGFVDEDGYLQITDRVKDIIIRGGENISAAEIEELLLQMPVVSEVAVVAAPDPTYGERACAMVRVKPDGGDVSLEAVRTHLAAAGLARQKWPESVRVVDEFPRTPSGKIKKAVLREQLRPPRSS